MNKPTRCFIEEKNTNIDKFQISTIEMYLREKKEKIHKIRNDKGVINIKRDEIFKIIRHYFANYII